MAVSVGGRMRVPGFVACVTVAVLAAGAAMAQVPNPSPIPDNRAVRVPPAAGAPLEPCPEDMGARRGASEPFACTCTAQAADQGTVFGTDVYADASSVCRAARHAGVIGPGGGAVTMVPEPGRAM
jgi:hypothetical protein